MKSNYLALVQEINTELENFIKLTKPYPDEQKIGLRNMHQEVAHIAFWHKYYANNLSAVSKKEKQPLFKQTYKELEILCDEQFGEYTRLQLYSEMRATQKKIEKSILTGINGKLKYKYSSRLYTIEEYLETIISHLKSHNEFLIRELKSEKLKQ